MPQITLLSQETIDKIAAGEVVERPSSVVKELVENAIDAQASAITVEIKEGGISMIRITDNGCGITRSEVPLAFLRHSTSKIKSVEDLLSIHSLGFRGEALSSIAAVSQVELITKTYGELTGTRYVIEGSKEKENEEIGAPDGTTFIIRNLFYNVPARRKFLKTAQTEGNYISDLIERLALSHPDVSFKFINNGQTKMHTSGNSNEKDMIYHIYGRDITASLLSVHADTDFFTVRGFIGKPLISRGNRNYENYFINGRYIKSALLSKAIEEAYKGFMMQHQYPFCVLYFTMDSDLLDVNVHPTKMELRFSKNEEIYQKLYQIIRDALTHKEFIPEVPIEDKTENKPAVITEQIPEPFEKRRIQDLRNAVAKDSPYEKKYPEKDRMHTQGPIHSQETMRFQEEMHDQKTMHSQAMRHKETQHPQEPKNQDIFHKLLPEYNKNDSVRTNNILGSASGFVDSKGDKEKAEGGNGGQMPAEQFLTKTSDVLREDISYTAQPEPSSYEQQSLLTKEAGFLSEDAKKKHKIIGQLFETYWLIEYEDKLFIIDQHAAHEKVLYERTMERVQKKEFTSQTLSPPIILTLSLEEAAMLERYKDQIAMFGYSVEHFGGKEYAINAIPADFEGIDMRNMFLEMLDDFNNLSAKNTPDLILEKVASMSCKAAVKGNHRLSLQEMDKLIGELLELENPYLCPHGRPTIISMSKYEIEKKFKRII